MNFFGSRLPVLPPADSAWSSDTLILPLYVGAASIVTFLGSILWNSRASFSKTPPLETTESSDTGPDNSIAAHISELGGKTIFAFNVARFIGCLVLLGISTAVAVLDDPEDQETSTLASSEISPHKYLQLTMCAIYVRVSPNLQTYSRNAVYNLALCSIPCHSLSRCQSEMEQGGNQTPQYCRGVYILCVFLPRYLSIDDVFTHPHGPLGRAASMAKSRYTLRSLGDLSDNSATIPSARPKGTSD